MAFLGGLFSPHSNTTGGSVTDNRTPEQRYGQPESNDASYRAWLMDAGQQALVTNGDHSITSPIFLAFKAERGPNGEWLNPEQVYKKRQVESLQDQQKLDAELQPFVLESMGLMRNAAGQIEKIPPPALTPEQLKQKELDDLYKEHLTAAAEGRLPVDLATENTLNEQQRLLSEGMSRNLGTNWRESTPGVLSEGKYMLSSEATKEAARHGDLTTAAGLLNQRQASLSDITQRQLGGLQGMGGPAYSLANSYGTAQQPYLFQGLLNTQLQNQLSANQAADTAGKYGLIGSVAGGATYGYMKYSNQQKPNYGY